jgi:hypothetical protein
MSDKRDQGGGSGSGTDSGPPGQQSGSGGGSIPIGRPESDEAFRRRKEEAARPKPTGGQDRPQEDR